MTGPELLRGVQLRNDTAKKAVSDKPDHPCTRAVQIGAIAENQEDTANFLGNGGLQATITAALKEAIPSPISKDDALLIVETALTKDRVEHSTMMEALKAWQSWTPKQKMATTAATVYGIFQIISFVHDYRKASTAEDGATVIQQTASNLVAQVQEVKARVKFVEGEATQ